MNIVFTQIYVEPGVDFDLPGPLLRAVRVSLSDLDLHAPNLVDEMQRDDFKLVFVLGAHKDGEVVKLASPIFRRRQLAVEIRLSLPWVRCDGFGATAKHVLPHIGEGVSLTLPDGAGLIRSALLKLLDDVMARPDEYQWSQK